MDPVTLGLIMGGAQVGIGGIQRIAANRRRKNALANFNYDIPSATKEIVSNAREKASQNEIPVADVARSRMESNLAQTGAKGENVAQTTGDLIGLYAKLFGQRSDFEQQILESNAQYRAMNEDKLNQALGVMADAENQQFYYNKLLPLQNELGYATDQATGGAANIQGGLQTMYQGFMNKYMMDEYEKIYGSNNNENKADYQTDVTRNKLDRNSNVWASQAVSNIPKLITDAMRTSLSPMPEMEQYTPIGNNYQWQNVPEWQRTNPITYPPSWLKYR